jgi:signal transduction histidine kinase
LLAPGNLLACAMLVALAVAATVTFLATDQNWLGLRLAFDEKAGGAVVKAATGPAAALPSGTVITSVASATEKIVLTARDFVAEPAGAIPTYREHYDFLERQGALSRIVNTPEVTLTDKTGKLWRIVPRGSRPLFSLSAEYWVQIVVGAFAWLIAAAIWAFRRGERSARYVLLSGWATLMFAPFAAVYSTRELALNPVVFRVLNDLNFLGGSLWIAALIALLLYYPRPIAPPWAGWVIVAVFVAWWVAQEVDVFENMTIARRLLVLIGVTASFVLSAVQWRGARADPIARASLQWFLLAWLVGAGLFTCIIFVPEMAGVDVSALQGYSFLLFILIYAGLAFGIMRFKLFELGEWWMRVVVWTISIALLVALDLVFVVGLEISASLSLALSLAICGVVWLPLRGFIWSLVLGRPGAAAQSRFQDIIGIAFTAAPDGQMAGWTELLRRAFDPLEIAPAAAEGGAVLKQDGLVLAVPAVAHLPALEMKYKARGTRLFNRVDADVARELADMLRHAIQSRSAYEQGVAGERRRIASDIHDNLGASLLDALHSTSDQRKNQLIRETLADLRSIVNDSSTPAASLGEALAHIRRETANRLEAVGLTLDWPIEEAEGIHLPSATLHALRSIVREAISNVLKHSAARAVTVRIAPEGDMLKLRIADDGCGFGPAVPLGSGLANMKNRAASRGGSLTIDGTANGTVLSVTLPLSPSPLSA